LHALAQNGVSLIVVSSELPEIRALTDRICIMYEGELVATLDNRDVSDEEIMQFASGNIQPGEKKSTQKKGNS